MNIELEINGTSLDVEISPSDTLFAVLRRLGYHGVKFGDEQGLTGADTVLMDGCPVNSGSLLAAQAEGHLIVTIEGLGEHPDQGWRKDRRPAPPAACLYRDRRHPVRLLHPGADIGRQSTARQEPQPD